MLSPLGWRAPPRSAVRMRVEMSEADILDAKILIVDDQEANVVLLEEILDQAGYRDVTSTMSPQ